MSTTAVLERPKLQSNRIDIDALSEVLLGGDLSRLPAAQKVQYYNRVCELVGLNPLTKPFDYIKLNGREVLYANKGCAEQLRMIHKISIKIVSRETIEGVYVVTVEASGADGRVDSSTGAVPIAGAKGEALANAFLKCETKAKRRVTLSLCGLNMLDETEVESIAATPVIGARLIHPEQPDERDGVHKDVGYLIPFGKYAKRRLEEIDLDDLRSYVTYIERKAEKDKKPITGAVADFIDRAVSHIAAIENGAMDAHAEEQPEPGADLEEWPTR